MDFNTGFHEIPPHKYFVIAMAWIIMTLVLRTSRIPVALQITAHFLALPLALFLILAVLRPMARTARRCRMKACHGLG